MTVRTERMRWRIWALTPGSSPKPPTPWSTPQPTAEQQTDQRGENGPLGPFNVPFIELHGAENTIKPANTRPVLVLTASNPARAAKPINYKVFRLTFTQKSLFVQHGDRIGAENRGLDEGVEGERHAGTFFFYASSSVPSSSTVTPCCRKPTEEVVQHFVHGSKRFF